MRKLQWALTGALWMAICIAAWQAFERWGRMPLLASVLPGRPQAGVPSPRSTDGELYSTALLLRTLPELAIVLIALGVIAAGWWTIKRWQARRAQLPAL